MKTIEEKAKAYDEALKWMRELYPGLHGATKEDAERYFSELRESEDEEIRRTLVEYFGPEAQLDFVRGVPIQKIRDWLEKQKESLHITESRKENADSFTDSSEDERIRKVLVSIVKWLGFDSSFFTTNSVTKSDVLAYLEKQEQKPRIEICPHSIKSKSYKENGYPIENCDYGLEIAYDILVKTFGEVRGYKTDDGIREHQTAIEAVRKAKEQKPALTPERIHPKFAVGDTVCRPMWSEHTIREIYVRCDDPVYVCVNEEGTESHISLSEQDEWERKEQKSVKDKIIEDTISYLNGGMCFSNSMEELKYRSNLAYGLKSLRPSWKPSDEQMEALEECGQCKRCIKELYEQLKKLM